MKQFSRYYWRKNPDVKTTFYYSVYIRVMGEIGSGLVPVSGKIILFINSSLLRVQQIYAYLTGSGYGT